MWLDRISQVNMKLTVSCKLVEVFAMISAVFFYKIKPKIPLYFSNKSCSFSRLYRISSLQRTFAMVAFTVADYNRLDSKCRMAHSTCG